jgi:hypothetical protein
VDLTDEPGGVKLRGVLSEDDDVDVREDLAAAFRRRSDRPRRSREPSTT